MVRDPRAFLWDVCASGKAIEDFVRGMDSEAYLASPMAQSAVERKFEIIGEALSQLSKVNPVLAQRVPNLVKIIAFRNLLIHGYAVVNH